MRSLATALRLASDASKPDAGAEQDRAIAELPPFLRTLLVADGTVTKSLEAYYSEPICVDSIQQEPISAAADIPWLGIDQGSSVLSRSVELRGKRSSTIYARAFSIIRSELLPSELRVQLLARKLGIGELIRNCGLETYCELLEVGFEGRGSEEQVYRTYRFVLSHSPAILITERFPIAVFRSKR